MGRNNQETSNKNGESIDLDKAARKAFYTNMIHFTSKTGTVE